MDGSSLQPAYPTAAGTNAAERSRRTRAASSAAATTTTTSNTAATTAATYLARNSPPLASGRSSRHAHPGHLARRW
jgi:hypothetical protein